jgi:hypothetical protein
MSAGSRRSPDTQRAGVDDQLTEEAAAFGPVVDPLDLVLIEANRDELGQPAALSDDPERTVLGVDQSDRRLNNLPEDDLQLEIGAHRDDRLEQRVHAVPGLDCGCQPDLELAQQVVKPEVGQNRPRMRGSRIANEDHLLSCRSYAGRAHGPWPQNVGQEPLASEFPLRLKVPSREAQRLSVADRAPPDAGSGLR